MQRYFLTTHFNSEGRVLITGEDEKHITRVMRMSIDDQIICVSSDVAYICSINDISDVGVLVEKRSDPLPTNEMPVAITIACGLPKGDKLELIVQKGTELGMSVMQPFVAERSIVKWDDKKGDKKVERLRKIAKEAAEQCHRSKIPNIETPISLKQLVTTSASYDVLLFADEEDAKTKEPHRIADRLKTIHPEQKVLVVFGPEGGLARNEAELLSSAGFLPIALGPRILRTETAPLYLLSAMSYEFE